MNPGPITFYPCFNDKPAREPDAAPTDGIEILRAADHPAAPVEWLWPNRIPIGKVTLLVGDPGLGKSILALDVASRVTRAAKWPDEATQGDKEVNPTQPHPGSVILLSAEDALDDTIRPRLDAAGANAHRAYLVPSIADLRHDLEKLRDTVDRVRNCRLIILDPVNAYVGPNDSHFQIVVRRILAPLTKLAREKRLAVLAVAHLRKTHGAAIHRTAGSMGFVAAARAVWTVVRDPKHSNRNLLVPLKHNLTAAAGGLAFNIETHAPSGAPFIAWDPTPITTPADELLTPPVRKPRSSPERTAAEVWLREALMSGPRPARDTLAEGECRGFSQRTLYRAIHELGGHIFKGGLVEAWWWSLGNESKLKPPEQGDTQKTDGNFEVATNGDPQLGHPLSQVDPILQSILTPSSAKSITAIDLERLARAERKTRERRQRQVK